MGRQAQAKADRKALRLLGKEIKPTAMAMQEQERLPPWTPFRPMVPGMSPEKRESLIVSAMKIAEENGTPITRQQAEGLADEKQDVEMWQNSRYTVLVFRDEVKAYEGGDGWPAMHHLSIRRNDRDCPKEERWRDFQRIKTELIGPDNEGVEMYPAEDRVADCANQFHIYVLADPKVKWPFGFKDGMRAGPIEGSSAVQRPFED